MRRVSLAHCRVGGRNIKDLAGLLAGGQLGPDFRRLSILSPETKAQLETGGWVKEYQGSRWTACWGAAWSRLA